MEADGRNQRQVGNLRIECSRPAWARSGDALVVGVHASGRVNSTDLFIVRTDGSLVERLTWGGWADCEPAWAPDGRSIACVSVRDGTVALMRMELDGTREAPLVTSLAMIQHLSWAPAGNRIVFVGETPDGDNRLYVAQADGSHLTPITEAAGRDSCYFSPAWSPDGKRIAFMLVAGLPTGISTISLSGGIADREIYVMASRSSARLGAGRPPAGVRQHTRRVPSALSASALSDGYGWERSDTAVTPTAVVKPCESR